MCVVKFYPLSNCLHIILSIKKNLLHSNITLNISFCQCVKIWTKCNPKNCLQSKICNPKIENAGHLKGTPHITSQNLVYKDNDRGNCSTVNDQNMLPFRI